MLSTKKPTKMGFFALAIWSFSALFASQLKNIPTFEMLSVVFSISALTIFAKVWYFNEWYKLKQPIALYLIGIIGIYGNDLFYFEAFKHAPATHVDLINYLWPIIVVIVSTLIPNEQTTWNQIIGSILSFLGIFILIHDGSSLSFSQSYFKGYGFALADAAVWAFYILALKHYRHKNQYSEVIGLYCLICAIFSLFGHFTIEKFVPPTTSEFSLMVILGIFSQGLAYIFWEQAIKKGDYKTLSNCAYFTPISSVLVLILFNKANLSLNLLIASLFVTFGAFLANQKHAKQIVRIIVIKLRGTNDSSKLSLLQKK